MKKKLIGIFICMLFVGVSVSSAFAVDTKQSMVNKASEEECIECKEVSKTDLIKVERLLNRVEVYSKLLLVLSRNNPELNGKSKELIDLTYSIYGSDSDICNLLLDILIIISYIYGHYIELLEDTDNYNLKNIYWVIIGALFSIIMSILVLMTIYDCDDPFPPFSPMPVICISLLESGGGI